MKPNFLLRGLICTLGAATLALAEDGVAPSVTKSPAAAADGEAVGIARRDGVTVSGTEAFVTRNGVTEKLVKDLELPSGVIARPDGTIILPNHTSSLLQADQLLTLDGRIINVPPDPHVNPAPPVRVNSQPVPTAQGTATSITTASTPVTGGGSRRSVFLSNDGTPFMGTITAPGVITSFDGTIIPIDGSIRAVSFGANGVPSVGQLNANGTIVAGEGTTIFPDGSVRDARGTLLSPATPGRGAAVAPSMMNPQQGTNTSPGVASQPGGTNPQGLTSQPGLNNQQGVTSLRGATNQQGFTNQQGVTNQQGQNTTGGTTAPGATRQPGNAAPRTQGNTPATNGNAGGAVTNGGASAPGGAPAGGAAR